jgi:hypothetical protein
MNTRQILSVAYASMTEGADAEARATFDGILEGTFKPRDAERKQNAKALAGLGVPVGTVK